VTNSNTYCLLFDMPERLHHKADIILAGTLGTSFVWAPYVNETLTTLGLGIGVFIGVVRAWKTWKYRNVKD
jgi:hypothetical protein